MESYCVHYSAEKHGPSIIFSPSQQVYEYEIPSDLFSDIWHITFTEVIDYSPQFFRALMSLSAREEYMTFAVMGNSIDIHALISLIDLSSELFAEFCPQFTISPQIASSIPVDRLHNNRVFVGSYYLKDGVLWTQIFNVLSLSLARFGSVFSIARKISDEISLLPLNDLSKIIWIDNWMQKNVQYIQDTYTTALGKEFYCPQIKKQATVPDVLLNHYGVCEDISVSIGLLLSFNQIPYEIIQANGHAWLVVRVNGESYIWDCTRNITRNEQRIADALQAKSYTCKYTLIGANTTLGDYPSLSILDSISSEDYPRDEIQNCIDLLQRKYNYSFSYSEESNYSCLEIENERFGH